MDYGVKNVFYDGKNAPPQRWMCINQPIVYLGAIVAAVGVYAACTYSSSVSESLLQKHEALVDLGYQGLLTTMLELIPVQRYELKLVILIFITVTVGMCLHKLTLGANKCIEKIDSESMYPKVKETKSFVETRLSSEQYELQRMENTRIELEKLTASEEFKRHQSKSRKANKIQASQSLANIKQSDIYSESGFNGLDDHHNMSMAL